MNPYGTWSWQTTPDRITTDPAIERIQNQLKNWPKPSNQSVPPTAQSAYPYQQNIQTYRKDAYPQSGGYVRPIDQIQRKLPPLNIADDSINQFSKYRPTRPQAPTIPNPTRLPDPRLYTGSDLTIDLARDAYIAGSNRDYWTRTAKRFGMTYEQFMALPGDVQAALLRGDRPIVRPDLTDKEYQDIIDKAMAEKAKREKAYKEWLEKQKKARGVPPHQEDPYNDDTKKSPFNGNSPYNPKNIPPGDSLNPNDPASWTNPDNPASPFNKDNPNNPWDKNDPMNPGNPNSPLNPKNPNSPYNPDNPDSPYYPEKNPPFENGTPGGLPGSGGSPVIGTWTLVVRAFYQFGPDSPPYTYSGIPGTAADTFGSRTVGDCIQLVQNGSIVLEPCYTKISNRGLGLIIGATFTPPPQTQPKPDPQTSPPPFPPPAKDPDGNPNPDAPPIPAPANPPAGLPAPPPSPAGKPALDPNQSPTPAPSPAPAPELPRLPNNQPFPLPPMAPPQRQPGTAPGTGAGTGISSGGGPQPQNRRPPTEIIDNQRNPGEGLLPGLDPVSRAPIDPITRTRLPPSNFLFPFNTPFDPPLPNPNPNPGIGSGGGGTGTGEGNPFPCRYKEDELALVKVQKVQVAINGRQRVEQDLSLHEKMTDFAALHFSQIADIKAGVDRLEKSARLRGILQTIDLIATLHNAAMLSRNLASTLGDAASTVLTATGRLTGLVDAEQMIDVNEILQETTDEFMKRALGEQVWNGTKENWIKFNRIVSTASNIVWSVRSMMDSMQSITEWTAENTGRIGNALKKFGVVGERAYPWMAERVNAQTVWQQKFQRVRDNLENLDDAASSLTSVAGEVINIQDEFQQLNQQKADFQKALEDAQPKPPTENKPNKDAADATKTASLGKDIEDSDLGRNEDATA